MQPTPLSFRRRGVGLYGALVMKPRAGSVLVEVALRLPTGYLERYCRYARIRNPDTPPTFLNTDYAVEPPGRRVGPWPGWRGIPGLPIVMLQTGGHDVPGKYYFLGDEEVVGELRVVFACEAGLDKRLKLTLADDALRPLRGQVIDSLPPRAEPMPVMLREELRGVHPRLVVGERDVAQLRASIRGSKIADWRRLLKLVRESWGLPYVTTPEGKVLPGAERLTGADRVMISAVMAVVRPTPAYVTRAKRAFFDTLRETARPDFGPLGIDTQSGEVLYVLCVGYDWLHAHLKPAQRRRAREHLDRVAAIARRHLDPQRRDYAQAHYLGCGMGLLAYAFLFWDEHPPARAWAAELRGAFERVLHMLPPDGFFPHGVNLWIYEHGFLLRWLELFRQCIGEDLWGATCYWKAASHFRAAVTSPDERHGVTFGDPQYRVTGDSWCHFLVAQRTGAAEAQALGAALLNQAPTGTDHRHAPPRRRVYELLWREPKVPARPLADGVLTFPDGGQVVVRRGNTLVALRSGAPLGRRRRAGGEVGGYGHSDPCNGAVLVWRGGTFVGSGPGPLYRRDTALHNLVTIDARGQVGDSCVWFPDYLDERHIPPPPLVTRRGGRVTMRCELAAAYLPHLGVIKHTRTVTIAPTGGLTGEDRVELSREAEVAWHWHTWADVTTADRGWQLTGPGCRARLTVVPEEGDGSEVEPEAFVAAYPHEGTAGTVIRVRRRTIKLTFRWRLDFQ